MKKQDDGKNGILELKMPRRIGKKENWINEDTINKIIDKYENGELLPRKRD